MGDLIFMAAVVGVCTLIGGPLGALIGVVILILLTLV